jgi:hypothetical protein
MIIASLKDYNELFLLELTIDLLDYLLNMRPDLVDLYLDVGMFNRDKVESLMQSIKAAPKKQRKRLARTRLVRIKLSLLINRFLVGRACQTTTSLQRFSEMLDEWDAQRNDTKYWALLERNAFSAVAINACYMDEVDERHSGSGSVSGAVPPFANVYRRINEPSRNVSRYSAELAAVYAPFHLHSLLIRFAKFKENGYFVSDRFERKMLVYLREIRKSTIHTEFTVTANTRLRVKALKCALWGLCSMLNCEDGFAYLALLSSKMEATKNKSTDTSFQFVASVVKLAETYPLLSVRATAFLCLNYLSKTATGAKMAGLLGWITFQPNSTSNTRAFYASYGSQTSQQLDLAHFFSHMDVAVALYNINRSKADLQLKKVEQQVRLHTLCIEDREFLDRQTTLDHVDNSLATLAPSLAKVAYFHENVCLPMQIHLLGPKDNSDFCPLIHLSYRERTFIAYRYR